MTPRISSVIRDSFCWVMGGSFSVTLSCASGSIARAGEGVNEKSTEYGTRNRDEWSSRVNNRDDLRRKLAVARRSAERSEDLSVGRVCATPNRWSGGRGGRRGGAR